MIERLRLRRLFRDELVTRMLNRQGIYPGSSYLFFNGARAEERKASKADVNWALQQLGPQQRKEYDKRETWGKEWF